jgi:dynein heavy chain
LLNQHNYHPRTCFSIVKAEPSGHLETRLGNLKTYFLLSLYHNICRSLFKKDKLLFSFLLAVCLMEFPNELDHDAYRFLFTNGVSLKDQLPGHPSIKLKGDDTNWVSMKSWGEVSWLSDLKAFPRFYEHFYSLNLGGSRVRYANNRSSSSSNASKIPWHHRRRLYRLAWPTISLCIASALRVANHPT